MHAAFPAPHRPAPRPTTQRPTFPETAPHPAFPETAFPETASPAIAPPAIALRRTAPATAPGEPFATAGDAWFWFMQAQEAKAAGARVVAGLGLVQRPCEPLDVYRVVDRLYRARKLLRDHLLVMIHYGRRLTPPDPSRDREARAAALWDEAFDHLTPALRRKGLVL